MTVKVKETDVVQYTSKAVLVRLKESDSQLMLTTGLPPKQKEVWVPKSIIQNRNTWKIDEHMDLPEWFCEKELRW